jgi:hypothetical protein
MSYTIIIIHISVGCICLLLSLWSVYFFIFFLFYHQMWPLVLVTYFILLFHILFVSHQHPQGCISQFFSLQPKNWVNNVTYKDMWNKYIYIKNMLCKNTVLQIVVAVSKVRYDQGLIPSRYWDFSHHTTPLLVGLWGPSVDMRTSFLKVKTQNIKPTTYLFTFCSFCDIGTGIGIGTVINSHLHLNMFH